MQGSRSIAFFCLPSTQPREGTLELQQASATQLAQGPVVRDSEIDSSSCWTHSCCVGLPGGHKHRACCAVDTPLGYRWKGHSETILRVSKLLPNSPNFGWTQKWFFGSRIGLNQQGFIAQAVPTHTQLHAQGAAASSSLVGAGVAGAALLVWHEIETNCKQMKRG